MLYLCRHDVPEAALSDRGTNFQVELMDQILNIKRLRTSAYHPQCDGETERFNRTLEQMLACYVADNQKEWDKYLPKLAFAYNTAVHATMGIRPFEIVYGRQPKLPIDLLFPTTNLDFNLTADAYASKVQTHLLKCYDLVEKHSQSKVNKFKFYADRHVRPASYVTGERVSLLNESKKKGISKKLSRKWSGPYTIIEKLNENNYKLRPEKPGKKKLVHVNRLKKCNSPPPNVSYDSMLEITKNSLEDQLSKEGTPKGINQPRETMGSQTTTPIVSTAYQPETDKGNNDGTFWIDTDHLTLQSQEVFSSPLQNTQNQSEYIPNHYLKQIINQEQPFTLRQRPTRTRKPPDRLVLPPLLKPLNYQPENPVQAQPPVIQAPVIPPVLAQQFNQPVNPAQATPPVNPAPVIPSVLPQQNNPAQLPQPIPVINVYPRVVLNIDPNALINRLGIGRGRMYRSTIELNPRERQQEPLENHGEEGTTSQTPMFKI
ncbi:unnamed protein product [Brachionus calyciflorus]|uniref:Integrase catalytic domain-containing protein n=1 Tax=Brachionus calyciflorus TaxID=104777 RepID=A0A813YA24_9BILA|nr:unnamed protein product [Brachionus calyciflorus]